jgi:hypothetical protein
MPKKKPDPSKSYFHKDIEILPFSGKRVHWKIIHTPSGQGLPAGYFELLRDAQSYAKEIQELFDLSGPGPDDILEYKTGLKGERAFASRFREIAQKHGGLGA